MMKETKQTNLQQDKELVGWLVGSESGRVSEVRGDVHVQRQRI